MPQENVQPEASGSELAGPVQICGADGCSEPALYGYAWEWGETGVCCEKHRFLLQQAARNIKRSINFHPLAPMAPKPMTRDERTKLQAAVLVLQEELKEAKVRGGELYSTNTQLAAEVQRLTVRDREARAQVRDAAVELKAMSEELDRRTAEFGELSAEVQRLRALVPGSESRDAFAEDDTQT